MVRGGDSGYTDTGNYSKFKCEQNVCAVCCRLLVSSSILRNKTDKVAKFVPSAGSGTLITEANCILVTNLKIVTKRTKSLLFGTFFAHNKEDIDR